MSKSLESLFVDIFYEFDDLIMYRDLDGMEVSVNTSIGARALESCGFKKGKKNEQSNQDY